MPKNKKKLTKSTSDSKLAKKVYANTKKINTPIVKSVEKKEEFVKNNKFDPNIFIEIPRDKFHKIPVNTQIGYIYTSPQGKTISIKSAFVNQHYISSTGQPGLFISSGKYNFSNLYSSFDKIFYYKKNHHKIQEYLKNNPESNLMLFERLINKVKELENKINYLEHR